MTFFEKVTHITTYATYEFVLQREGNSTIWHHHHLQKYSKMQCLKKATTLVNTDDMYIYLVK